MIARITALLLLSPFALAQHPAYDVEKIEFEPGIDAQVGGIDVLPDGQLAVCFHRGDVRIYDPKTKTWSLFATGLHEPLGLVAESASTFVIMQRPELTRISDTDGDGKADRYETLSDDFGMTGNYHEFAFGPVRDAEGNYFVSLNVASNGASVRDEVRGQWLDVGLPREKFYENWGQQKGKAGRMYSRTPWRGWVLKIDAKTGDVTPWASGFRSPNGLGFDAEGNLFVSDNQGDWLGTSKLHHVKKGRFHGHPASLPWDEKFADREPLKIPIDELEKTRTPAAIWFTQGRMANSPTQPILIPDGFGPFAGQMLIGEMNKARVIRLVHEEVNGVIQGACVPFLDNNGLGGGINRLAFGPGDTLWTGQTKLSWAGGDGMRKVTFHGEKKFQDVKTIAIQPDGFRVEFLEPVADGDLAKATLTRYSFKYQSGYGSPEVDKASPKFEITRVSETEFSIKITEDLKRNFVYEFHFPNALNKMICYTVREIPGE